MSFLFYSVSNYSKINFFSTYLARLSKLNSIFPVNAYTLWFKLSFEPDDNAINTIAHIGGVTNWSVGMAGDRQIHLNDLKGCG